MKKVRTAFDKLQVGDKFTVPTFPLTLSSNSVRWVKKTAVLAVSEFDRTYNFITCIQVPVEKEIYEM